MLIAEAKKRGKPYGLIFDDIAGGFTFTRAGTLPQAFKVMPLVVRECGEDIITDCIGAMSPPSMSAGSQPGAKSGPL